MPDVLGEIVPNVGAEVRESAKAMGFAVEALDFEHICVCLTKSGESGKDCEGVAAGRTVKVMTNIYIFSHHLHGDLPFALT